MNRFRKYFIVLLLVLFSLLMFAALRMTEYKLDRQVGEYHLRYTGSVKGVSPVVSFTTVALGGLRGLVADLLWLRTLNLQQKGDYFEMVQLAQWITDLQPEFSGATSYLAWNMAYNVSVACSYPEDRWRWIHAGISLLRDRAMEYNPEDSEIYFMLAWIFKHKLGDVFDEYQNYYKNQFFREMMRAITPDLDLAALAEAPATDRDFAARYPETGPMQKAIRRAGFADVDALYDRFSTADLSESDQSEFDPDKIRLVVLPPELKKELNNPKLEKELDDYLRARYLRQVYKLDPGRMLEVERKYGKMDWRLPESQAIYWALLGIEKSPTKRNRQLDRIITQSLMEAYQNGRLMLIDPESARYVQLTPNFDLFDSVVKASDEAIENNDASSYKDGKRTFLKDATVLLYSNGRYRQARHAFDLLHEMDENVNYGSLEDFVVKRILEFYKNWTIKDIQALIDGYLTNSFVLRLYHDDRAADGSERIAKRIYAKYQREHLDQRRLRLAPYSRIKRAALEKFLASLQEKYRARLKAEVESGSADDDAELDKAADEDLLSTSAEEEQAR